MCFGSWDEVLMRELLWLVLDGIELVPHKVGHIGLERWRQYMDFAQIVVEMVAWEVFD